MIWTLIVLLVVFWLAGFLSHVAVGLIHLLLVIAAVALVVRTITGRRGRV